MIEAIDTILCGDALATLKTLPDGIAHCCVTSPPYLGLRSYLPADDVRKPLEIGLETTIEEYIAKLVAVFREVKRVLRPEATLWLNLGDAYANDGKWGGRTSGKHAQGLHGDTDIGRSKRATGLPSKSLVGMPWRIAFALQEDGWILRSDIIWCLSGGTRVYARTQKGEMPMMIKDMVRLEPKTVQLWNGEKWTQVLGWGQNPRPENAIELTLRSGERIGCTPEHQWPTQRGVIRASELQVGDVIQTCKLPEPKRPRRPIALDDETVGWFVGLYIAEGSRSDTTIQIAGHLKETARFENLCQIAEAFDGTCRMHKIHGNAATINLYGPILNGIIDAYVGGKLAKGKHLTTRAWQRSDAFLRGVLDGYLSGDGHKDPHNDRWRIGFTRNYAWEADLRTLCARLGVPLTLNLATVRYDGRDMPTFRGEVRFNHSTHWNAKDRGEVVRIGHSKGRQFWDISVADEPHLFALASGVLTHNCKLNPMPESVRDRPTRAHEYIFLLAANPRYYYDAAAIREPLAAKTYTTFGIKHRRQGNDALGKVKSDNWGSSVTERKPKVWSTPAG